MDPVGKKVSNSYWDWNFVDGCLRKYFRSFTVNWEDQMDITGRTKHSVDA